MRAKTKAVSEERTNMPAVPTVATMMVLKR